MSSTTEAEAGIIRVRSHHSVAVTIDRLRGLLQQHGILVFAHIDFSGDAARAGLQMRAEQMLIFGNPKAGTPLMVSVPTSGLDLPLKALVWEDADGNTWIAYSDPQYIVRRHGLAPELGTNLAAVVPLLDQAARAYESTK